MGSIVKMLQYSKVTDRPKSSYLAIRDIIVNIIHDNSRFYHPFSQFDNEITGGHWVIRP